MKYNAEITFNKCQSEIDMTSLREFIYFHDRRKDLKHLIDSKNENSSRFQAEINEKKGGNESFVTPVVRRREKPHKAGSWDKG